MTETRVALVTGANRGIGYEIVRGLARQGLIAVMGSRSLVNGEAAATVLAAGGVAAPVVALDVTDEASVRAAVSEVMDRLGRIDVLVNNAAILLDGPGSPVSNVASIPPDMVRATYETNVIGPLRMIQACLPIMRRQGYGRIVNLSSRAGQIKSMGAAYPAYRLSKAALNALTLTTAAELGGRDIKINAMCPGWVRTEMGGPGAPRSPEQGAMTAIWLAMLPTNGPSGGFFSDKLPIAW